MFKPGRTADTLVTQKKTVCILHATCPALACTRRRTVGRTCLKPKDLENTRVNSLISLVVNTRLGNSEDIQRKYSRTLMRINWDGEPSGYAENPDK